MIRLFSFLLLTILLGSLALWVGTQPGKLAFSFQEYQYETNLLLGTLIIIFLFFSLLILTEIVRYIYNIPHNIKMQIHSFQKNASYEALSKGIIAAASEDIETAYKKIKNINTDIAPEEKELLTFLEIQTLLLEKNPEKTHKKCIEMLDVQDIQLIALKELYNSMAQHHYKEAWSYALRAHTITPNLCWTYNPLIEERIFAKDWDGALHILQYHKSQSYQNPTMQKRKRAGILTAKAMHLIDIDIETAYRAAYEAHKILPSFIPAACIKANILFQKNQPSKAEQTLENTWEKNPHPTIAALYLYHTREDTAEKNLLRAKKLYEMHPNHIESSLLIAQKALTAGDFLLARYETENALRIESRQSAWLLLVKIEEATEARNQYIQEYLSSAVQAIGDPVWTSEGYIFEQWSLQSPISGKLDTFTWSSPSYLPFNKKEKIKSIL